MTSTWLGRREKARQPQCCSSEYSASKRQEGRFQGRVQKSGLKEQKTLEAFEWAFQPKLDKSRILEIAQLDFVGRNEDLLLTGKAGTGKSHILQALALRACQRMTVRYARCVDLVDDLYAGLADGSYPRRMKAWVTPKLVVIDDVGLGQIKKRDDEPTTCSSISSTRGTERARPR